MRIGRANSIKPASHLGVCRSHVFEFGNSVDDLIHETVVVTADVKPADVVGHGCGLKGFSLVKGELYGGSPAAAAFGYTAPYDFSPRQHRLI